MNSIQAFDTLGCVKVDEFIDSATIAVVSKYLENKIRRGDWVEGVEGQETWSKLFCYADPLIEVLLEQSCQKVEDRTGKALIPTYSYTRIYQAGERLKPHLDRPSCEISATINVATRGEFSPIFVKYKELEPQKFYLNPGDAVIYKGCEAVHWREQLAQDQLNVQFMLHYVEKNGPNAGYARDKRPAYGMNCSSRK